MDEREDAHFFVLSLSATTTTFGGKLIMFSFTLLSFVLFLILRWSTVTLG